MDNKKLIKDRIYDHINVMSDIASDEDLMSKIHHASQIIIDSYRKGGKLFICGNGGSAADAQHISAELSGRFYKERAGLSAIALHTNSSHMTAVANDYGYDHVYERLIEAQAQAGDILLGLSTSGNSINIVNAFSRAKNKNVTTIAFTGGTGGRLAELCDILINIPSSDTPRIQEAHIAIGHIICEIVEDSIFPG